MSDEQRKEDEIEVEGHWSRPGENDEPIEDPDDEIEAHVMRMD